MIGDAVHAIDPGCAHWARIRLLLAEHEMVNDDRAVRPGEKLAEGYGTNRRIAGLECRRTFLKRVVLDGRAFRKTTPQFRDSFALAHQFDLGIPQLFSF